MIIFYNKQTGDIVGTIDGRVHTIEHSKMWIGNKDETDRIVVQWVEGKEKEVEIEEKIEKGKRLVNGFYEPIYEIIKKKIKTKDYEPMVDDEEQKNFFIEIDKNPMSIYEYKVDLKSKKLIKIR